MQIAAGAFGLIERNQNTAGDRLLRQPPLFFLGTVAPDDSIRFGELSRFGDPLGKGSIFAAI